jgi:RimJ/RimL family protein N-acetyltransferase
MRLKMVPKTQLSKEQAAHLRQRIAQPIHAGDAVASGWDHTDNGMVAFVRTGDDLPIGIADVSGLPVVSPAWWLDLDYRGQGYGNDLVDLIGDYIDSIHAKLGNMVIQTKNREYDEQSTKLVKRLRARFPRS